MNERELKLLVFRYLDGRAAPAEIAALSAELQVHEQSRRTYWSVVNTYQAFSAYFDEDVAYRFALDTRFDEGLAELAEQEQHVNPPLRELPKEDDLAARWEMAESNARIDPSPPEAGASVGNGKYEKVAEIGPLRIVRRPRPSSNQSLGRAWRPLASVAGIAAMVMMALLLMREPTPVEQVRPVATVTHAVAAQWEQVYADQSNDVVIAVGALLEQGQAYRLTRGFAELEMPNGTTVVLEAPVEFDLQGRDVLRMERGRLVARAGEGTEAFTVVTPTASVTDLGTEFGVSVDEDGRTESSVFEGVVRFIGLDTPDGSLRSLRVTANHTASAMRGGDVTVESSADRPELAARYRRAMPESEYDAVVLNAEPIAFWRFGDLEDGVVPNIAGLAYAAYLQGSGRLAREPHEHGLALRLPGDEMYFTANDLSSALQGLPAYTFEVLVQPEDIHHGSILSLLQEQGPEEQLAAMILELADDTFRTRYARRLRFGHRNPPAGLPEDGSEIVTDQPYTPGQWLHIVAVKDREDLHLYVNGQHVGSEQDSSPMAQPIDYFHIGAHRPDYRSDRFFKGLIASAAVYPRALSSEQVADRHEILSGSMP